MNNHKFHIPVMGLAFTIDTPIKVARFGISSVIPIGEERLIEMMRSYYYPLMGLPYIPILSNEDDCRSKRITDYLNLVNTIVSTQIDKLRNAAFEKGSEIVKYFEMLPEDSKLKKMYLMMTQINDKPEAEKIQSYLREAVEPGNIDVNIMTKTDRNNLDKNGVLIADGSDAVSALRGYANSNLKKSSVVFSAGMNPRLFNYLEGCRQFDMNEDGSFDKKITIKVSDYRSAIIQGKYLAKKGIWVSEFRIESGLNCGGHAFATDGYLLGPILEEFKTKKQELVNTLLELYIKALNEKGSFVPSKNPEIRITVQGGIGTYEEDTFLHEKYEVSSTGWGTPFLLVPEATAVDGATLDLLCKAEKKDIELSHHSPLGVRFYYLKGTTAEKERLQRIEKGKPGSPCIEKHLTFNTEFTEEPICTASHKYQKLKIAQLKSMNLGDKEYEKQFNKVVEKECLCVGLSNTVAIKYHKTIIKNMNAVTICPGPNIVYFNKIVSLQTMVDHIYGRTNIIEYNNRPNMFINELVLYINYLKEKLIDDLLYPSNAKLKKYYTEFYNNLSDGIAYYRNLNPESFENRDAFHSALNEAELELNILNGQFQISA